jgi:hypothetical protein
MMQVQATDLGENESGEWLWISLKQNNNSRICTDINYMVWSFISWIN